MKRNDTKRKENYGYSIKLRMQRWFCRGRFISWDIQSIIMAVLTALTIVTTVLMGFLIYSRFKMAIRQTAVANTESVVESAVDRLEADLLNVRQISNAVNYNIIQEYDISSQEFERQFSLLYEINTDKIQSMALYDNEGNLVAAEPLVNEKADAGAAQQDWYRNAADEIENIHFSSPHIQNLFEDGTYRYYWVISLSRSVDINDGEKPVSGVLLVDMKYSMIREILERINQSSDEVYYYLCNRDGEMIYHPRQAEIDRGLLTEESGQIKEYEDGTYELPVNGQKGSVVVGSISYTGWRLVGVVPDSVQTSKIQQFRYYIVVTTLIFFMMLLGVNRIVARKISNPIFKKYAQDYKIHIISPKEILESDLKKFSSSLREVIGCIKYSNDKNKLAAFIQDNPRMNIEVEAARVLEVITHTHIKREEVDDMGNVNMCKAIQEMIQDGRDEGRVQLLVTLIQSGDISLQRAAALMNMTPEEFQEKSKMIS